MQAARLAKELETLKYNPPWGISCNQTEPDKPLHLEAKLVGPRGSPYECGIFNLHIDIPSRYPFEPPQIKFVTQIYHPNIDKAGRICMDLLKMPPKGEWRPTMSLESILIAIQVLLENPNPDDPLMIDVANQYRHDREGFIKEATDYTIKYAK